MKIKRIETERVETVRVCDYPDCKLEAAKSIIWIHIKNRADYCLPHFEEKAL